MKNTFGNQVAVTLFGESHGEMIGAVLDGLGPGIPVDEAFIARQLSLRRPYGKISTGRVEEDRFQIVSGVFEGKTTGTPLCILIPNENKNSADYASTRTLARPGHADYTAQAKYHGFQDYRGGGHFSGRITAALVAAGAIAITALSRRQIVIGTHIARCGGVSDRPFREEDPGRDLEALRQKRFAVLDDAAGERMKAAIEQAALEGDSVGGILETTVLGLPAGVGEPWFDSLEGVLAHALFSIPGIKGVQFGGGFDLADERGSAYNDAFYAKNGVIRTRTNHNGGVNGGITNGMPVTFRLAVKPTPSIYIRQDTVDFTKRENTTLALKGRHDPAIIHRARVVADSVTALVLADVLSGRFGTDYLAGENNIVLTGMPGSGKSTLGILLAEKTGRTLVDTDQEIVKRTGMPITEIFRQKGEGSFRDLETGIIREASGTGGKIIATGGGSVLREENVNALKANGTIVFLDRPVENLEISGSRPLADDAEKIRRLYEERLPVYRGYADYILPVEGSPEETAEALLRLLPMGL